MAEPVRNHTLVHTIAVPHSPGLVGRLGTHVHACGASSMCAMLCLSHNMGNLSGRGMQRAVPTGQATQRIAACDSQPSPEPQRRHSRAEVATAMPDTIATTAPDHRLGESLPDRLRHHRCSIACRGRSIAAHSEPMPQRPQYGNLPLQLNGAEAAPTPLGRTRVSDGQRRCMMHRNGGCRTGVTPACTVSCASTSEHAGICTASRNTVLYT